jgi:hypothetical protein
MGMGDLASNSLIKLWLEEFSGLKNIRGCTNQSSMKSIEARAS